MGAEFEPQENTKEHKEAVRKSCGKAVSKRPLHSNSAFSSFCVREALSHAVKHRKHASFVARTESDPVQESSSRNEIVAAAPDAPVFGFLEVKSPRPP